MTCQGHGTSKAQVVNVYIKLTVSLAECLLAEERPLETFNKTFQLAEDEQFGVVHNQINKVLNLLKYKVVLYPNNNL